jgi:leucyl aminopeptidase
MNQFLEDLKARMADAQKRLQAAAMALQTAQQQHQAVAQEFGSLQYLFQIETRKAQGNSPNAISQAIVTTTRHVQAPQQDHQDHAEINKTKIVRQILQEHPNGMEPNDLWKAVSNQIAYRPYLYSILKRLRDKGDVFKKRGKYFPRITPKPEDGKEQAMVQ